MNPSQPGVTQDITQRLVQPQHAGNWFTHLLPTIGGTVVPWALGALLAPETGGLSLLGSAAASGAGAAGGKAVENATEGKGAFQGNDLTAGAEGAGGALAGGLLGKVFSKGSSALAGRATNLTTAADQAASQEAETTAANAASQATRNNFGGVNKSVQIQNDLGGNQDLMKSWGLDHTSPDAMQSASKGGLFIHDIDQAALAGGSPIKTSNLLSTNDIMSSTPQEQQALANAGIITPEGTLPDMTTPQHAAAFASDLNTQVRDSKNLMDSALAQGRTADYTAAKAQYDNLNGIYKNVQNVAGTPEVNASIAARTITPEEKTQLVEQYGQKQADHIEKAVNEAQTHSDLVTAKLPFAQMNNLSTQALKDMQATATPLNLARDKMNNAPEASAEDNGSGIMNKVADGAGMLGMATGHPAGMILPAVTHGAKVVSKVAQSPEMMSTLSRIDDLAAKLAPAAAVATTTALPNMGADPMNGGTMPAMNPAATGTNVMPPQANPQQQFIDAIRSLSILNPDRYGTMGNSVLGMTPQLQHNEMLSSELNGLPASFANAGGAQGMGGLPSHILAMIPGTAAHAYDQERQATANQLAQAMGISPQAAMGLLSQVMNNPQTAGIQQGILGSMQGNLIH